MIRAFIAVFLFAASASATTLWTCTVSSTNFANQPIVFKGMGTTKGLAQIRAQQKCQASVPVGLKACKPGACSVRR